MSDVPLWFENNDMVLEISNVTDKLTGNLVDDATINATLKDSNGVDVTGITWPQTLDFVSSGLYRKLIDMAIDVVDDGIYTLQIVLTTPGGIDAYWEVTVGGEKRT